LRSSQILPTLQIASILKFANSSFLNPVVLESFCFHWSFHGSFHFSSICDSFASLVCDSIPSPLRGVALQSHVRCLTDSLFFDSFRHHRCLLVESNIFQHFLNCAATNRIPSYFVISQECKCLFSTKEPFRVLTFGFGSVIPGVTMQYSNHKQQYHIRCIGQSLSTLTSNGLFTISKGPIRSVFMNSIFYRHFLQWPFRLFHG